ncbi:MAG: hypothetical protein WBC44_07035 [Planctomycetaceae bacterium]
MVMLNVKVTADDARRLAEYAHEERFELRRLVEIDPVTGRLFYANNHPYSGHPERRGVEESKLRGEMVLAAGVNVLAESHFPADGDSVGYSTCIVFDCGDEHADALCGLVDEVCGSVNSELP